MTLSIRTRAVLAALVSATLAVAACNDDDNGFEPIPPGDADISANITANRTLYADTTYTLTDYVHVNSGVTLTIQPGTTILGTTGSALFIMRGARIIANGTAADPIVFTSDQPVGSRKPGDWGGLIIVGNGIINRTGQIDLEGTGSGAPSNIAVTYSGGTDNADSSGVLRYVRVEFAGFGVAANNELNSLTLAAVGSRTKVEFIQTLAGFDDSFEWFGGAVDGKYLVSYESGDDHFDAAEGYVGRNQFLIALQDSFPLPPRAGAGQTATDPQGFEVDGCGSFDAGGCGTGYFSTPLNVPMFANFTVIGTGASAAIASNSGGFGMVLRRGTGGYYVNGIIARWPKAAIALRDSATATRATAGDLVLRNISIVETGTTAGTNAPMFEGGTACPTVPSTTCRFTLDGGANAIVAEAGTVTAAATFAGLPAQPTTATLDFSLVAGAAARTGGTGVFTGALLTKGGTFVLGTTYRGAWDPSGTPWWAGWTNFAQN
jgi:hypothetical protein